MNVVSLSGVTGIGENVVTLGLGPGTNFVPPPPPIISPYNPPVYVPRVSSGGSTAGDYEWDAWRLCKPPPLDAYDVDDELDLDEEEEEEEREDDDEIEEREEEEREVESVRPQEIPAPVPAPTPIEAAPTSELVASHVEIVAEVQTVEAVAVAPVAPIEERHVDVEAAAPVTPERPAPERHTPHVTPPTPEPETPTLGATPETQEPTSDETGALVGATLLAGLAIWAAVALTTPSKRRAAEPEPQEEKLPPPPWATVRWQWISCGKPNCTPCQAGPSHGPYVFATWKEPETNRTRGQYMGKTWPRGYGRTQPKPRRPS